MRISSAKKPLNRTTARNSFLINQFATPGLGSLMAGRWVAGIGQLLLSLAGFCLVLAWFFLVMTRVMQQINGEVNSRGSVSWLGEAGALVFAAAWLWSLVTSLQLLHEARAQEFPPDAPRS